MTDPPAPAAADPRAGRVGFGVVLAVVVVGLVILGFAPQHWLRGVLVVAGGLAFGGLVRFCLPDPKAGPLFVRGRWFDGTCYLLLGAATGVFAVMVS